MNKSNKNDLKRFVKCMAILAVSYDKTYTDDHFDVWFDLLSGYEIEQIEAVFRRVVTNPDTGQFAPKPADIIRMLEGSSLQGAAVAWTKLEQAIGSPGVYCDVCFDDAIINKVVFDLGGWVKVANTNAKEWAFVEKDFKERYSAYRSRGTLSEYPKQLTGIANAANATGSFPLEPVRLVGNQAAARLVHEGGKEKLENFVSLPYTQKAIGKGAKDIDSA